MAGQPDDLHLGDPVVVFLPARDEVATVADVVRRVPSHAAHHPVEVVVVDDGSVDGTAEAARQAGAHVVPHGEPRGLGAAVRTGLELARARGAWAVAFLDADGEYDPAELEGLLAPIAVGEADYVVGQRIGARWSDRGVVRRLGNAVFTVFTSILAGRRLRDAQSGFRALNRPALAAATVAHDYNYAQVLTLDLVARGHRYVEVPISYRRRRHGRSFVTPGRYLGHVVPAMVRVSGLLGVSPPSGSPPSSSPGSTRPARSTPRRRGTPGCR